MWLPIWSYLPEESKVEKLYPKANLKKQKPEVIIYIKIDGFKVDQSSVYIWCSLNILFQFGD